MKKKWSEKIESENKTFPHTHFNLGIENIWKCTPRKWKWKNLSSYTLEYSYWKDITKHTYRLYQKIPDRNQKKKQGEPLQNFSM